MASNDKSIAISGGVWTSISTAITLLTTMGRVMVLTRFLEKSDFGLVSITNMVIALCATFTDLGFASVIMYKQKFTDREFSSLYWMQLFLFLIIYCIIGLLAPIIAGFYEEPMLSTLLPIAALSMVFQAVGSLYDSVLQKKFLFKLLAFRNIVSNLFSLVLAVILAWKGLGVFSLVISTLSQVVIMNTWNFISGIKIQRPRFTIDIKGTLPLIRIGIYQTGTRILDFFSAKLDIMIIGKLLGTEALGVYDLAKDLVFKLVDFVRSVVSKVALPIISNNNSNEDLVRVRFLQVTKIVAYLCVPICATIAVFSKDVVNIIYGKAYIEAAPIVSIFAVVTMLTSIASIFDMLGVAKGRTDLNFKNTICRILVTTPVIALTSLISITAVALGQLGVTFFIVIFFWFIVVQNTYPISFKLYFSQFDRLLAIVIVVALLTIVLMYYLNLIGFVENWVLRFVLSLLVYVMMLIGGALLLLKNDIRFFISLFRNR